MSDTGLTVPGMTEPPRRYDVIITVDQDLRSAVQAGFVTCSVVKLQVMVPHAGAGSGMA